MSRKLLVEMAVKSEEEVFEMNPIISLQSSETQNMEGEDLKNYIYDKISTVPIKEPYIITNKDVGAIISHHCTNRNKKKIALLAIPYIINANLVTEPWRKKTDEKGVLKGKDRRPSGIISAPILIDDEKYLCNLTIKTNRSGVIFPYALTLKNSSGNIVEGEKMGDTSNAPDSNDEHSTCGNAHLDKVTTSLNTTPSLDSTNIAQNIQPDKENNQNNINCSKNMNKNKIRLTESQLHRVIKESVRKILKESFQSQKLARLAQLHGGIDADYSGQWARNSISTLTDNKIYDKLIFNDKREAWKYIDEHYQNYGDKWICALYDCVLVFNDGKAIIVGGLQGEKQYIQRKQYNQGDKYGGYISNNRYYSNLIDNYKLKNKNEDEYNAHKNPYFNFEKSQRAYKIRNAIMKLRRQGWTDEQILAKYPKIKPWLW